MNMLKSGGTNDRWFSIEVFMVTCNLAFATFIQKKKTLSMCATIIVFSKHDFSYNCEILKSYLKIIFQL